MKFLKIYLLHHIEYDMYKPMRDGQNHCFT